MFVGILNTPQVELTKLKFSKRFILFKLSQVVMIHFLLVFHVSFFFNNAIHGQLYLHSPILYNLKEKNMSDVSTLTVYEIKNEEIYICIIVLNLKASKLQSLKTNQIPTSWASTILLLIEILYNGRILSTKYFLLLQTGSSQWRRSR